MMKTLVLALFVTLPVFAETSSEEAIVLNQELKFLEDSARDMEVIRPQVTQTAEEESVTEGPSLERTYFSDAERDEIRTRAAAPKRIRSF